MAGGEAQPSGEVLKAVWVPRSAGVTASVDQVGPGVTQPSGWTQVTAPDAVAVRVTASPSHGVGGPVRVGAGGVGHRLTSMESLPMGQPANSPVAT